MSRPSKALLEALVASEREASGPSPEVRDRMWTAIDTRLSQGPPAPELGDEPLLTAAKGPGALLKIVGVVAVVAGLGGGAALLLRTPEAEAPAPELAAAAVEPGDPTPAEPPPSDLPTGPAFDPDPNPATPPAPARDPDPPAASAATTHAQPKPSRPTPRGAPKQAPQPKQPKTLAEEIALMQRISTALKQGDSTRVAALVSEHERDFPKGQLIEERRAAKARSLCMRDKLEAGRKQAQQFAARWPGSIHLAAVERDCKIER